MTFAVTARHVRTNGTSASQTSGASNSTTPTANSLFLVCWSSQNNASATAPSFQTPTGGGLTYTQVRTAGDATSYPWDGDSSFRVASAVYRANVGGSPSAFAVTVDSAPTTATFYYGVVCLDVTGHDATSPIVGTPGIAGGTKAQGNTETGTVTLGATPTAGNLIVVVFGAGADAGGGFASPTAGVGKTFTTVTNQTTAFCQTGVFTRVADGTESTTITCSDLGQTVGNYSAIAFEIAAEPGGTSHTQTPTETEGLTDSVQVELPGQTFPVDTETVTDTLTFDRTQVRVDNLGMSDSVLVAGPESFITGIAGSGNQQYPVDQSSDPILVKGDVIWAFPGNAGRWGGTWQSDITGYLDARQAQGFNLLMIGALGSTQNGTISDTGETFDGVLPFSGGNGVLNNTYWTRVDYIIDEAAARGITVLLNVAYSYDMDTAALSGFSNANYTTYGTNLGNRYKTKPNLIWGAGGDYFDTQVTQLGNLFTAVQATGDTHLISIQNYPETTSRKDIFNNGTNTTGVNWSDWNFVYSYNVTYDGVEYAYDEASPICVIWGDGHFDQDSTPDRKVMRDLVWWALSSGARGHIYGSEGTWAWGSGALANVTSETVPSTDLANYWDTFTSFTNWHQLVPDTDSSFVTAGRGTHAAALSSGGGGGEYNSSDTQDQYVTASVTPDGTLAVVYFPVDQTITVDDTELNAGYTATWVDPTNGSTSSATIAGTYSPTGTNALGGPDWLLVFEAAAGSDFTETPADTEGLTDAAAVDEAKGVVDPLGLTDSRVLDRSLVASDTEGLSDVAALAQSRPFTDAFGLTDSVTVEAGKAVTASDTEGITDSAALVFDRAQLPVDAEGLTDSAALAAGRAVAASDTEGLSDAASLVAAYGQVLSDAEGLTDSTQVSLSGAGTVAPSDNENLSDVVSFDRVSAVTDTQGLSDGASTDEAKVFSDAEGLTDVAGLGRGSAVVDTEGLTDTVAVSGDRNLLFVETLGLSDSVSSAGAGAQSVTDTLGLADTVQVVAGHAQGPSDTLGLTDQVTISGTFGPVDTLTLTDLVQSVWTGSRAFQDAVGLSDLVSVFVFGPKTVTIDVSGREGATTTSGREGVITASGREDGSP